MSMPELFTVENIKPHLHMFAMMSHSFEAFLPADNFTAKAIFKMLKDMLYESWFASFLCYTLNTFRDKAPTKIEIAEALEFFALKLRASGMNVPMPLIKE